MSVVNVVLSVAAKTNAFALGFSLGWLGYFIMRLIQENRPSAAKE